MELNIAGERKSFKRQLLRIRDAIQRCDIKVAACIDAGLLANLAIAAIRAAAPDSHVAYVATGIRPIIGIVVGSQILLNLGKDPTPAGMKPSKEATGRR